MKFQINHRFDSSRFVYECELPDDTPNAMRAALIKAVNECANLRYTHLRGADLRGADLSGAHLRGADLSGADLLGAHLSGADLRGAHLRGADLSGAHLRGAHLRGADLSGADLSGADLSGADLSGADLGENKLVGERPYFSIGPIGSRQDTLTLWITEKGPLLKTGCFGPGTFEDFRKNLERDHEEDSTHRREYEAALLMCEAHAALWTPEVSA